MFKKLNDAPVAEVQLAQVEKWKEEDLLNKCVTAREGQPEYVFFEGPPTANGKPGIHHVMARTLKDSVNRYCTMKGYQLLAGKMSVKGMIIGGIIMLLMTYVGHNVDWAISVAQYFEVDVFSAFRAIPDLVKEEVIDKSTYFGNMGLLYLFTLLGAVPAALGLFANSKMKHVTTQMMAR